MLEKKIEKKWNETIFTKSGENSFFLLLVYIFVVSIFRSNMCFDILLTG